MHLIEKLIEIEKAGSFVNNKNLISEMENVTGVGSVFPSLHLETLIWTATETSP